MAEHQLTCAHCGAQFVTDHKRKYCTRICGEQAKREAKRIRLGREKRWPNGKPEPRKMCVCIVCQTEFMPKALDRTKCCGRRCGTLFAGFKSGLVKSGGRVSVKRMRRKCTTCGKPNHTASPYCTETCRPDRKSDYVPVVDATCRECGCRFHRTDEGSSRYICSPSCGKAARKRRKKLRRAIQRGALGGQAIKPEVVFDRDGWRCGLCHVKTPIRLRGTSNPRAPELDHIIPVSMGGLHTYANTQCLCRSCNGKKGARVLGQLSLFPMGTTPPPV